MRSIRLMRGQVVIRETKTPPSEVVWTPEEKARSVKIHRGRVLAMGPPAEMPSGAPVPHGFDVGDVVLYTWTHNEKAFTMPWVDGENASWIPQVNVQAVLDV